MIRSLLKKTHWTIFNLYGRLLMVALPVGKSVDECIWWYAACPDWSKKIPNPLKCGEIKFWWETILQSSLATSMYLSTRIVTEAKSYACNVVSKLSISNATVSNAHRVGFRYGYSMKWYYAFSVLFLRQAIQFPVPLSYTFTLSIL